MSSITVVCPNARRCVVKVTPGTLLKQVVEEACLKQGFEVNKVEAKNHGRLVDLSLPFRLSGLPNNATIELSASEGVIGSASTDIALQLPDGTRKQLSFSVATSLEDVLGEFSKQMNQELLSTEDGFPSMMYMNKQYTGDELKLTALSSIGTIGGKHLIRFSRRQLTEEEKAAMETRLAENARKLNELSTQFEKMKNENEERERLEAERQQKFEEDIRLRKEQEPEPMVEDNAMDTSESAAQGQMTDANPLFADRMPTPPPVASSSGWSFESSNFSLVPIPQHNTLPPSSRLEALTRMLNETESSSSNIAEILANQGRVPLSTLAVAAHEMVVEAPLSTPVITYPDPCDRCAVYFPNEKLVTAEKQKEEPMVVDSSNDDLEIGTDDLKARQRALREEVKQFENRPFLPKEFIERKNRDLKLSAYQHTVLRFTIGSVIVQANFLSAEPSSRAFEFISSILPGVTKPELIFAVHDKVENSSTKNLIATNCSPKSTIIVKGNTEADLSKLTEISKEEADNRSSEWLSVNTEFKKYTGVEVTVESRVPKRPGTDYKPSATSPVPRPSGPKWFKK